MPELKRVVLEALAVTAAGLAFALAATLVSPRGLSLTRNYFPGAAATTAQAGPGPDLNVNAGAPATNSAARTAEEVAIAHLKTKGLNPGVGREALQLVRDPQYEMELTVFVDARDDRHYQEGHIPGAYQFDRYYPEKHLAAVLAACLNATKIVVYCSGGTCEDSEFAALTLKDAGLPQDHLFVYVGGMTEWAASGFPIEIGARKSGTMRGAKP